MLFFNRGPVVPVLRFTGPIGMATPLRPGLALASVAGAIEKAFNASKLPTRGDRRQFARRLAGAIALDLQPHPPARQGEGKARLRLLRRRRRFGRLLPGPGRR